jgi:hypothetical protein
MCSLLMRLQRSTSLFNFGCFAAPWQHAEVNQKAQIAAATQNVKWKLRMKGLPMNFECESFSPSRRWITRGVKVFLLNFLGLKGERRKKKSRQLSARYVVFLVRSSPADRGARGTPEGVPFRTREFGSQQKRNPRHFCYRRTAVDSHKSIICGAQFSRDSLF